MNSKISDDYTSVHAFTSCSDSDWNKWKNGELKCFCHNAYCTPRLVNENERDSILRKDNSIPEMFWFSPKESDFKTYDEYFGNDEWKGFSEDKMLENGEIVHLFGHYTKTS